MKVLIGNSDSGANNTYMMKVSSLKMVNPGFSPFTFYKYPHKWREEAQTKDLIENLDSVAKNKYVRKVSSLQQDILNFLYPDFDVLPLWRPLVRIIRMGNPNFKTFFEILEERQLEKLNMGAKIIKKFLEDF